MKSFDDRPSVRENAAELGMLRAPPGKWVRVECGRHTTTTRAGDKHEPIPDRASIALAAIRFARLSPQLAAFFTSAPILELTPASAP
jgi:hypothetical protein